MQSEALVARAREAIERSLAERAAVLQREVSRLKRDTAAMGPIGAGPMIERVRKLCESEIGVRAKLILCSLLEAASGATEAEPLAAGLKAALREFLPPDPPDLLEIYLNIARTVPGYDKKRPSLAHMRDEALREAEAEIESFIAEMRAKPAEPAAPASPAGPVQASRTGQVPPAAIAPAAPRPGRAGQPPGTTGPTPTGPTAPRTAQAPQGPHPPAVSPSPAPPPVSSPPPQDPSVAAIAGQTQSATSADPRLIPPAVQPAGAAPSAEPDKPVPTPTPAESEAALPSQRPIPLNGVEPPLGALIGEGGQAVQPNAKTAQDAEGSPTVGTRGPIGADFEGRRHEFRREVERARREVGSIGSFSDGILADRLKKLCERELAWRADHLARSLLTAVQTGKASPGEIKALLRTLLPAELRDISAIYNETVKVSPGSERRKPFLAAVQEGAIGKAEAEIDAVLASWSEAKPPPAENRAERPGREPIGPGRPATPVEPVGTAPDTPADQMALAGAWSQIRCAVEKHSWIGGFPRDEILLLLDEARAEVGKERPNRFRLGAVGRAVGAVVDGAPALKPAYEALREALKPFGLELP